MPVVGDATIIVRAITTQVKQDIQRAFNDARPVAKAAGEQAGKDFADGFSRHSEKGVGDSLDRAFNGDAGSAGARTAGDGIGSNLVDGFRARLEGAGLPNIGRDIGNQTGSNMGAGAAAGLGASSSRIGNEAQRSFGNAGSRGGNAFTRMLTPEFKKSAMAASEAFTKIYALGNIAGTGIAALVSTLSSLVSGLFAIASAAGVAAGALAVLPGLMGVALQAGGALKLAFSGVGKALAAGLKPAAASVGKSASSARAAAAAVANAEVGLARARSDAARRVADAQRNLGEAHRAAGEAAANAARATASAERDLGAAQRELTSTQRALTAARKEGREELQQLAFNAEDAALAEQRAGLNLEDAYAKLQAVQNLPADNKTRREAELSYKETELAYRQAKDRASDLSKEQKKAAKNGVNGTDAVISAQKDVAGAEERVGDAVRSVNDARRNQAKVAGDNARSIMAAERGVAEARRAGAQSVADAQRTLRQAQARANDTTADGAKKVDLFKNAMDKLSPSARTFVKYLISIKDRFDGLKEAIGSQLFPKLQLSIEKLLGGNMLPQLQRELGVTGGLLGDLALGIASVFEKGSRNRFGQVLKGNNEILEVFTKRGKGGENVMGKLVRVMMRLFVAIQPVTKKFAEWIAKMIRGWEVATRGEKGMNRLTHFFNKAGRRAALLGDIFKHLFGLLGNLAKAADPAGVSLLKSFDKATKKLEHFTGTKKGQRQLKKFFTDVAWNVRKVSSLLGHMARKFLGLGDNKGIGKFADSLKPAVDNFADMADQMTTASPQLGEFVENISIMAKAFADTKGIETWFKIINGALEGIIWVAEKARAAIDKIGKAFGIDDAGKKMFIYVGAGLAALRALGFVYAMGKKVFGILIGGPLKAGKAWTKFKNVLKKWRGKETPATDSGGSGEANVGNATRDSAGKARAAGEKAGHEFITGMNAGLRAGASRFATVLGQSINQSSPTVRAKAEGLGGTFVTGLNAGIKANAASIGTVIVAQVKKAGAEIRGVAEELGAQLVAGLVAGIGAAGASIGVDLVAQIAKAGAATRVSAEELGAELVGGLNAGVRAAGASIGPVLVTQVNKAGAAIRLGAETLGAKLVTGLNAGIRAAGASIGPVLAAQTNKAGPELRASGKKLALNLINGLTAGLREGTSAATTAVEALAIKVVEAAKLALGIKSPSTVFANIGRNSGAGFSLGLKESEVSAFRSGQRLGEAAALGAKSVPVVPNVPHSPTMVPDGKGGAKPGMAPTPVGGRGGLPSKSIVPPVIPPVAEKRVGKLGKVAGGASKGLGKLGGSLKALPTLLLGLSWPIIAIVAALVGLFFFFKGLYKHSPQFKKFIDGIVDKFKELGKWVRHIFIAYVFPAFDRFFGWVNKHMPAIQKTIGNVIDNLKPMFKILGKVVTVTFKIIKWAVLHLVIPYFKMIWKALQIAWKIVKPILGLLWRLAKTTFLIIKNVIVNVLIPGFKRFWKVVKDVVKSVRERFQSMKDKIQDVKDKINTAIQRIKDKIQTFREKVRDVVNAVKSKFQDMKDKIVDIKDRLLTVIDRIKTKFGEIKTAIANSFSGIGAAAKAGINAFIGFLNNKLIAKINKVTSKFGLTIPDIPKLAKGGPIKGRGGPTQDNHLRALSAGEYVLKASSVKRLGEKNVDYLNRYGRPPTGMQMFGIGDIADGIGNVAGAVRGAANAAWGALPNLNDLQDIYREGVGRTMSLIVGGAKSLMKDFGFKKATHGNFTLGGFFYGIMDKLQDKVKDWGQARDEAHERLLARRAAAAAAANGALSSGTGKAAIWRALRSVGYGKMQTAGVMGNMKAESGFDPYIVQGGGHSRNPSAAGSGGYGLVQWTPGSKLKAYIGNATPTIARQVNALHAQLSGRGRFAEGAAGAALKRTRSVEGATVAFETKYERHAGGIQGIRQSWARAIYNQFKNNDGSLASFAGAGGTGDPGGTGTWRYPLAHRYPITQYPNAGHNPSWSVDIGAPMGTAVLAAANAIVETVRDVGNTSYGRYIRLKHANGVKTLYAHLQRFLVRQGQRVSAGQRIARSNNTGGSTGPHLHFELMPSRNTVTAMRGRGVRLAQGGWVPSTPGGILAQIGEGGRNERVEPLDRSGLSKRDQAMIELIKASINGNGRGDNFHVYPAPGMKEAELAHMVSRRVAWRRSVGT